MTKIKKQKPKLKLQLVTKNTVKNKNYQETKCNYTQYLWILLFIFKPVKTNSKTAAQCALAACYTVSSPTMTNNGITYVINSHNLMCNIKNTLPRSETHFLKRSVLKFFILLNHKKMNLSVFC